MKLVNAFRKFYDSYKITPTAKFRAIVCFGSVGIVMLGYFTFLHILYSGTKKEFVKIAFNIFYEKKTLIQMLGEPVKMGHVYAAKKGSITNDSANAIIPVRGQKYDGILCILADKKADNWRIKKLEFEFLDQGGGRLRLVEEIND